MLEYNIATYFIYFMILAICGWIMEVVLQLIQKHKFVDRGFLIGPYCPIYGCGGLLITLCLTGLREWPLAVFCTAIVICGILEYSTSYVMEKIFHARWWDYSKNKYNINGRICLETIIPFGLLGMLLIYAVNPVIFDNLVKVPENILNIVAIVIAALFAIDNIVSFKVISNVRVATTKFDKENPKDDTEEISNKVKEFLRGKSVLNRRLVNAFPKLTSTLKETSEKIRQKTNEVREDLTIKANVVKDDVTKKAGKVKENVKKSMSNNSKKIKNITTKNKEE